MPYIGRVVTNTADIQRQTITGSTSATHTLTTAPSSEQQLLITINGLKQQDSAYTVSGTTLTLASALVASDEMEIITFVDVGTTMIPSDGSVTSAKIGDDAVTADKLASGLANATHTGDVTGSTALTIAVDAVDIPMLSATGTADATTFLRGDNSWATPSGGKILQVAYATYSSQVSFTTAQYSGLQASITPASTSNKVLVMVTCDLASSGSGRIGVGIRWGTTGGDTSGTELAERSQAAYDASAGTSGILGHTSVNALVSPNSTDLLYFKVELVKHDTGTGYMNYYDTHSSITLMEVQG